jgi:hypothetical protein
MVTRILRARRITVNNSETDQLHDQFIRQLTREAQTILKQMSQDFSEDLEKQSASLLEAFSGGDNVAAGKGLTQLFSTGMRYLFSRPRITSNTTESSRSKEAEDRFRVGQSQMMAEANMTIARGDKNL